MKIQFKPFYEMESATHILSGTEWKYGEIKDIADDASIRVRINNQSVYVNLGEDLLSSPNFVRADTDKNPFYTCSRCDISTSQEGYSDPLTLEGRLFEIDDQRVCQPCYALAHNAILITSEATSGSEVN